MSELVTQAIESLRAYEAGKPIDELFRELGISDAVKLASNENAFGPSPKALEALVPHVGFLGEYPDSAAFRLRERLSEHHGVAPKEVLHGSGSSEIIELLVRTFTTPNDHIVFADPAFVMYRLVALAHGVAFTAVPLRDLTHDADGLLSAVRPETRLMFIANPNNPTGTYLGREPLERLLRELPERVIVGLDEAYFEYTDAPDFPDGMLLRSLHERLVVIRTFSKIYGLAGLRVGYGIGPPKLIDYMNRLRPPFNVGSLGQIAARAALADTEHVEKSRASNREEKIRVAERLERLGFKVPESQANFVYAETGRDAALLYQRLLEKGVIVRPFSNLPGALRITIGRPRDNDRLLSALDQVLAGGSVPALDGARP